ncbi:MAG: S1C family serine protease [Pseudomonadota bacterium]
MAWLPASQASEVLISALGARGSVVLEATGSATLPPGTEFELTYQAGLLPMLIGRYRVIASQPGRIDASPVSIAVPPSQGMRVRLDQISSPVTPPKGPASSGIPPEAGRVMAVHGSTVDIELASGHSARVGDRLGLAFEAPRVGRVAIQGSWRITQVQGRRASAEAEGLTGQARVGQIALPLPAAPLPAAPADRMGGLFDSIAEPGALDFDRWLSNQTKPSSQATQASGRPWVGLTLQALTPELAESFALAANSPGILIANVDADSPGHRAGLRVGDVILQVDGHPLSPDQLVDRVAQATPGQVLRLRAWRGGSAHFIGLRVGTHP